MQTLKKFYFGKQKAKVNTYIGGIGGTINTPALLAARLGISESRIKLFKVTGVDLECAIVGTVQYTPQTYAFSNDTSITYFIDKDKLCGYLNQVNPSFSGNTNMHTFEAEGVRQVLGTYYFRGTPLVTRLIFPLLTDLGIYCMDGRNTHTLLYIPLCTRIGDSVSTSQGAISNLASSSKIYVHPSLLTINGGNPHFEIQSLITKGCYVAGVTNFTPPNPVTNLSTGTIYNTAVQLNFTLPTSLNGVDFYECYANGKLMNEIKSSGEFITGLTPSTNYNIRIVAVDMFYNKSELSNTVNVSTTNDQSLQGRTLGYFRLNSSTVDQKGLLTDTPNNITYSSGVSGNSAVFNGINSKVSLSNIQSTVGSISCWIKTANAGASYRGIFVKQFAFGIFLNNNKVYLYDWGTSTERATNVIVNNNTWRHIALTFQSGVVNGTKVYIDGALVLTTTISVSSQSSNIEIGNGGIASTGQFFTGSIDSVGLFDSILTVPEVLLLRDTGLAGNEFI